MSSDFGQRMQFQFHVASSPGRSPTQGVRLTPYTAAEYADFRYPGMISEEDGGLQKISTRPRLTKDQAEALEAHFQVERKPSSQTKKDLAIQTGLSVGRVANWFQNRRARAKQQRRQEEHKAQLISADRKEKCHSGDRERDSGDERWRSRKDEDPAIDPPSSAVPDERFFGMTPRFVTRLPSEAPSVLGVPPDIPDLEDESHKSLPGTPSSESNIEDEDVPHANAHPLADGPKTRMRTYETTSHPTCSDAEDMVVSEGELSFMATPSPGDLRYNGEELPNLQQSIIKGLATERISDAYVTLLVRARGGGEQARGSQTGSNLRSSSKSGSNSSQTTTSSLNYFNKRSHPDHEGDEENERPPPKRPSSRVKLSPGQDGKLLACPYAKFDPARYSERNTTEIQYRGCSSCFLTTIPRLKQHLYRVHSRPKHYCSCCFESFETAILLDEHVRTRSCNVSPPRFEEKMTVDQMAEIRRRTPREDQIKSWFAIFRILFPQADLPTTPFITSYNEECVQHILSYFEREAPQMLADALAPELDAPALLLNSEQRRMLDDILEMTFRRVLVVMTRNARERQDLQQQRNYPSTDNSASPGPSRSLEDSMPMRQEAGDSEASLPSQQTDFQLSSNPDAPSRDSLAEADPWQMVSTQQVEGNDSQHADIARFAPNTADVAQLPAFLPEQGEWDAIDYSLASEEWQRLVNAAGPLDWWQDDSFCRVDDNMALPPVQPSLP
ncbi:hypothetical protein PV08_07384 [Exophiala spinifera]|uniref:Homeobox domain-containing protein n=1 Tax=Exophiala spinifera TaxID=91928 RepID=A0A0D2B7F6_9EURO|nr:uncharacterized protein PV08_07384 [Exophiala spinifera]KIW14600.1 hypothetical protein PV08_07384 [Exophiala spinifera]